MTSRISRLRPYQLDAFNAVVTEFDSGKTTALVHAVMGSGKTEVAFGVMEHYGAALFLVNRVDLVRQTAVRWGGGAGVFCASLGERTIRKMTFASPQSVKEIADLPAFPLVVVDEAHRCSEGGDFAKLVQRLQGAGSRILGLSATPWPVMGKGALFERPTFTFGIREALDAGFIVRPKMRTSEHAFDPTQLSIRAGEFDPGELSALVEGGEAKIRAQVDEALTLTRDRRCCVWACVSIKHCEMVAAMIGAEAVPFHSGLTMAERETRMRAFKAGVVKHLVFVTIVAEGFDHPPCDTLVMMRPSRSVVLVHQMIGRTLRLDEGKTDSLIIDYGRAIEAIGPLDAPILAKKGEKKGDAYKLPPFKWCPKCFAYLESKLKTCPECGLTFVAPKREVDPNLEARAVNAALMSDEIISIEMPVREMRVTYYLSAKMRHVIMLKFIPHDLSQAAVVDFVTISAREYWLQNKAREKLTRMRVPPERIKEILKTPSAIKGIRIETPTRIRYHMRGSYAEVTALHY